MKRNLWKTLLSVVLLLTMLVSMLPFAAFAEDDKTAATQTEEAANTDEVDVPKVEENTGDAPKDDDKAGAAKTDEKSGAAAKDTTKDDAAKDETKDAPKDDTVKDETKDAPKGETKDAPKGETKDAPKGETKDESEEVPNGDTEDPPKGGSEDPNAQIATLEADDPQLAAVVSKITLTYNSNYPNGENNSTHEDSQDAMDGKAAFTIVSPDTIGFTAPDGYTFSGWNTQADGQGEAVAVGSDQSFEKDTVLYAQWGSQWEYYAPKQISIAYGPGGTSIEPVVSYVANAGENYTVEDNMFRTPIGKHFVNWKENGGETTYEARQEIPALNKNLELVAQWENDPTWSDLGISISAPSEETPNTKFNYRITVTNNTGFNLRGVVVDVTLPEEVTPDNTLLDGNWGIGIDDHTAQATLSGTLAAGDTSTFEIPVTIKNDVFGTIMAIATITDATATSGSTYESSMKETCPKGISNTVKTTMAGLKITKSVDKTFAMPGDTITYTIKVKNETGIDLENIIVSDPLSEYVTSTVENSGGTYPIDSLHKGETASTAITVTVNKDVAIGTLIPNTASITSVNSVEIETISSKTVYTTVGKNPDWSGLTITKDVNTSEAKPGNVLTYTITVENNTGTTLTGVTVEDSLPLDKVSASGSGHKGSSYADSSTYDVKNNLFTGKASSIANGGKAIFYLYAKINAGVTDAVVNEAHISAAASDSGVKLGGDALADKTARATTYILTENVPVSVSVEFQGLDDVSKVPANYKLTGDTGNAFLAGAVTLGNATNTHGHISRSLRTTADVVLNKEYALKFTQTGYEVPGYDCNATAEVSTTVTADAKTGVAVTITLNYVKENLFTYPSVTVRTYFKGLTKLPDNFGYSLTCTSAPEEATAFLNQSPLALTKGTENGVPYLEFSAKNVTLQAGTDLTFSFTQSGYDVPGYVCALGLSTFKFNLERPTTDILKPIQMNITNTYTQPDWSKLTITKAADKTRAMPGSVVKYTVTVTNNTGVDLSNIVIADKLDTDLRYSDSTGDYSTGTGTWTVASLANGKSVALALTVKLKYALAAGTVIDNTATVTSAVAGSQTYDLSSQKISDSVSVTVTSGKGSPRTGDESNLGLWIAVMAASLACAGAAAVIYKKRRG